MNILLLGGTSDAIALCRLISREHDVIYSIKGLVRQPSLNCAVHLGGFGGVRGLILFIQQRRIDCLLDATHPYAINISQNATLAAKQCKCPCLHYIRPAWQQQQGDCWIFFNSMTQLTALLEKSRQLQSNILLTMGQLPLDFLAQKNPQHHYIIRSALAMTLPATNKITPLKQIGPFSLRNERKLFRQYAINTLVSKNSGGDSVAAKLQIAREMQLVVYLLKRPILSSDSPIFASLDAIHRALNTLKPTPFKQ